MKKLSFFALALLFSLKMVAQDCDAYYAMKKGAVLAYSFRDGKGQETTVSETTILDLSSVGNGVKARIGYKMLSNGKGDTISGESTVRCQDDVLTMDFGNFLPPKTQASFESMEIEVSGDGIAIPNRLSTGQKLPDAHNEVKMLMNGTPIITMSFDMVEREVLAKETVTTPAGSYECMKISYRLNSGGAMINGTSTTIQWYAKGVGMVKSESYNKKGALESTVLLTRVSGL